MDKNASTKKRVFTVIKAIILVLIIVGVPLYFLIFRRDIISGMNSLDDVISYLKSFDGIHGIGIYLVIQILQIVISVLPGQVFQIAAGIVFGILPGLLFSILGILLGTTAVYYIARWLGADAMNDMLTSERAPKIMGMLNSEKAYIAIFICYLIPGFPKDLMAYLAGLSSVKFRAFLILSTTARIPALLMSLVFGDMMGSSNRTGMIVIASVVALVLVIGFVFRKRLKVYIDILYEKLS